MKVVTHGIAIGEQVIGPPIFKDGEISVSVRFRPDWIGIWALQALLAEKMGDDED